MSAPRYVRQANRWRDQFNPLRALTIQRLVSMLELGERGAYADIQWLYRFIEKRNATLKAAKQRRLSAIQKLDWDIKVRDDAANDAKTATEAEAQAKALRAAYERIDNLREAFTFLALAEFRGFSHLEKHYAPDGGIVHLEPVPQWYWVRDGLNGPWQYNADAISGTTEGVDIAPEDFIIREIDDPINEIAAIAHIRQNLSQKDWDGFVETYGLPPLFVEMPPNVPADKEAEYQQLAETVIADARGSMPNGTKVQTVDAGARGANPFRDHIKYQDECIVIAATGGKLTMLAESGSGTLAGAAHRDTFEEIAQADALAISEIFQCALDKPLLATLFPGQPIYAYFELAANEETDPAQFAKNALTLAQAGLSTDPEEASEKMGMKLTPAPKAAAPAPGAPFMPPQPNDAALENRSWLNRFFSRWLPLANRAAERQADAAFVDEAKRTLSPAALHALQPALDRLNALYDGPDAEFLDGIRKLAADIPAIGKEAGADPKFIDAWEKVLGGALANGLTSTVAKKKGFSKK